MMIKNALKSVKVKEVFAVHYGPLLHQYMSKRNS